jgi:hypothetical protein
MAAFSSSKARSAGVGGWDVDVVDILCRYVFVVVFVNV